MHRLKSTKLKESQLIAAELLGAGHRPSDVAKKLSIRKETISRWQTNKDFILARDKAHLEVLSNIVDETTMLTNKAHQALLEAFEDKDIGKIPKATIGIRYLSLVGTQYNIYEKNNQKHKELNNFVNNNEMLAKWFVDILDGIKNLEKNREKISDQQIKHKINELFNLSNNIP